MTELPWQWRLDYLETWQRRRNGPPTEWRFYPGTEKPHLRLVQYPSHGPGVWYLYNTFLSKEQREKIADFILSRHSQLEEQEILEVDWESYTPKEKE